MITQIGNHKISLGSVAFPQVEQLFSGGEKADLLYSDPPWGNGNMKYWATIAEKMTGTRPDQITFEEMLARFSDLITKFCTGFVFIEQGLRFENQTVTALRQAGVSVSRVVHIQYGNGKNTYPNILICGSVHGVTPVVPPEIVDMKGVSLVKSVIKANATPNGIVFDPCCGMGYSAKAALNAGMRFRGNELNRVRLAKTEKFLRSKVA